MCRGCNLAKKLAHPIAFQIFLLVIEVATRKHKAAYNNPTHEQVMRFGLGKWFENLHSSGDCS